MSSLLRWPIYSFALLLLSFSLSSCGDDNDPIAPLPVSPLLSGPGMINYGTLYAGECQDTLITYINNATKPATIISIEIEGSEVTWVGSTLPVTVAPGATMALRFRACPLATGALHSRVSIKSSTDSIIVTLHGTVIPVKRTTIGVIYAQPDISIPISLKVRDSVLLRELEYGQYTTAEAPVGERNIVFQTNSGVELASKIANVDSANSLFAVYSGLGVDDELILINTPLGSAPTPPLAGIRFIHASKNAPKVKVTVDVAQGTAITPSFIDYGKSNDAFTPVNLNTTALVVVDEAGNTLFTLQLSGASALEAGKRYTVVMYGSADPNSTVNQLTAKIFLDPRQ